MVCNCTVPSEQSILVKISDISMFFQPSTDSFGIRLLGFKCSWWHPRQANDAVASERSIFSKNHGYKSFFCIAVNPLVPIYFGIYMRVVAENYEQNTHTHTHTRDNYRNPRCACAPGLISNYYKTKKQKAWHGSICAWQGIVKSFNLESNHKCQRATVYNKKQHIFLKKEMRSRVDD